MTTNLVCKVLLEGLYDPASPLSMLRGCHPVLRAIWCCLTQYWRQVIKHPGQGTPIFLTPVYREEEDGDIGERAANIEFPPPQDININMMPFLVGATFSSCKLPHYVSQYWDMIETCLRQQICRAELGGVYYLTIQESLVEGGTSQRRPGLHVDSPGKVSIKEDYCEEGGGQSQPFYGHHWGRGEAHLIGKQKSLEIDSNRKENDDDSESLDEDSWM